MNSDTKSSNYISRESLITFPFPYKLWCVINSEACSFIKWNLDGTQIKLQMMALENYLNRPLSIFQVKSRSSFLDLLFGHGFKKVDTVFLKESTPTVASESPAYTEITMQFRHENFLRHRIDLLAKLRKSNNNGSLASEAGTSTMNRKDGDPCCLRYGALSKICKTRIKHQMTLNFQSQTKILKEKLNTSEMRSKEKGHTADEEDSMIELPVELFENPHDSVLYMGENHRTTYAGFYGNCDSEMISNFFGDYLPMYENGNNDEGEKRVADLNPTERKASQPNDIELNISLNAEPVVQHEKIPPIHLSSSLEPIFIPDEEKEEDISMEDFIKFKEPTVDDKQPTEPNQEPKIKAEVLNDEENEENEANFKNFFSQYRQSLSLLYEKQ